MNVPNQGKGFQTIQYLSHFKNLTARDFLKVYFGMKKYYIIKYTILHLIGRANIKQCCMPEDCIPLTPLWISKFMI